MSQKIKIGFDARMIEHSGIGIRIQNLLKYWPLPPSEYELFVFGDLLVLRNYDIPDHAKRISYKAKIYSIREWFGIPIMFQMDLLEIPHFNVPIPFLRKTIVTIHDLIPWHFQEFHSSFLKRTYLKFILYLIRRFAFKVLAVSQFTKQDLIHTLGFSESQVNLSYNGISQSFFQNPSKSESEIFSLKYGLPQNYVLLVGIDKPHKNHSFVFHSLQKLWKFRETNVSLVIAGTGGKISDTLKPLLEEFPEKVLVLPKVPYEDLSFVYRNAILFLYPSLWEGFGFPGLEALACGTPVLSSNRSCLPEVLGDAAVYFSPDDQERFEEQLLRLLANEKERRRLSRIGISRARLFLWEIVLQELPKSYESWKKNLPNLFLF